MQKKTKSIFILVAIAILAVAAMGGDFKMQVTSFETTKFALPNYGHIECLPSPDGEQMMSVTNLPQNGQWITCPRDAKTCDVYLTADAQSGTLVDPNEVFWALCTADESDCKGGIITQSGRDALSATKIDLSNNNLLLNKNIGSVQYLSQLDQTHKLFLMYLDSTPFGSWTFGGTTVNSWQPVTDGSAHYYFKYTPYVLRMVNGMGQIDWLKGNGCNLPNKELILSSTDNSKVLKDCTTNACEFGGYINWVDFWTSTEIFTQNLVTVGGQQYFCANGLNEAQLYSLGTMQTTSGTIKYPQTIAKRVTCCPNTVLGDKTCKADGSGWIVNTPTTASCFSDAQCLGAGRWMTLSDGATQNQYGCDTSTAKCKVTATRNVECSELKPCVVGTCYSVTGKCVSQGSGTLPIATGCLKDADCDDGKILTMDSCIQTVGEKITASQGTCENKDISAYVYIIGAIVVGLMLVSTVAIMNKKR